MTIAEFANWLLTSFSGHEMITASQESGNNPDGSIMQININDLFEMALQEKEEE